MSGMWVRGRAAERFDAAVSGRAVTGDAPPPEELAALVAALRALPEVAPRPEHSVALRERLMVEADRLAAERTPDAARSVLVATDPAEDRLRLRTPRRGSRRAAVLAGAVAALGASTTVAVAAQTALPGESLYPIKRALEDVRAGATGDAAARGELLLGSAGDRLVEAEELIASEDDAALAEVGPTLDGFGAQASEGAATLLAEYARTGDRELVRDLRAFTGTSRLELDDMARDLPPAARDAWARAQDVVDEIDDDAHTACPLCSADPTGFGAAGDVLGSGRLPSADPSDAGRGDGSEAGDQGRSGGGGRSGSSDDDRRLLPGRPDGDDRVDGRDPRLPGDEEQPTTPRLPEGSEDDLGDDLRDGLEDGVTSGLGDGLGKDVDKGLGDVGDRVEKGLRKGLGGSGDRSERKGRQGRKGGGRGLDDLLP